VFGWSTVDHGEGCKPKMYKEDTGPDCVCGRAMTDGLDVVIYTVVQKKRANFGGL